MMDDHYKEIVKKLGYDLDDNVEELTKEVNRIRKDHFPTPATPGKVPMITSKKRNKNPEWKKRMDNLRKQN